MGICALRKFSKSKQWAFQQKMFSLIFTFLFISVACVSITTAQNSDEILTPPVENTDQQKLKQGDVKKQLPKENSADQNQPEKETAVKNPDTKSDETTHPEIRRDLSSLPFPVRRMRELILEVALSGDIEKLRPLIGYGDDVTMLSLGGIEEDPLNFLKSLAGDENGHEILAILAEVLETGYVLMDEGTDEELYVWPYFFAWPLDKLTPPQKVELYRLVTYGDYEDMESFGAYIFYRLGITPQGRWRFFVAGD
jgi:hypothetical protein